MFHTHLWKGVLLWGFVVTLTRPVVSSREWPQWRGPNRDGVVASFSEPKVWPEKLKPIWKMSIGTGHSSPVVAGGRTYIHTRQDEREVVSSLDLTTGKLLWQESYPAPYTMNPAAVSHGKGPKSTPILSNGKLYTLGISGILSCFKSDTGKLLWRKEFSREFRETAPLFGTSMSPAAEDGLVIAHVGGHDQGALEAFNTETGEVKWSWKGDGPGHSSPITVELGGTRQIVTQTQKYLVGVSASNGELLWSIPFKTDYDQNIVTPLLYQQTLIFSGLSKGTMAIKVIKKGNVWSTEKVWENPGVSMYMNSPVLSGDLLFGLSHRNKGQFFCLDARTGSTLWTSEGRQGENAAMISAGNVLFLLTNDAELIVARKSAKGFEPIRRYTVAESPTWAHPVVVDHRILIKDASILTLWSLD
jgi:outer membrane protein assembly factor BamB